MTQMATGLNALTGKTAVVTGAASGIGKALSKKAFAEGMNVMLADVEEAPLEIVREELRSSGRGGVMSMMVDVSKTEQVDELARKTVEAFGGVELLFNNAGVGAGTTVWESSIEDWYWVMGVNLWGVIHGVRAFVPIMLKQNRPAHIVNTASIAGLVRGHHSASYAVSKHAVVALTEQLALEFERIHAPIKASVLCPSWVNTKINESARNRPRHLLNKSEPQPTPEMMKAWASMQNAIKQATPPEEIAEVTFDEGIRQGKLYILPHKQTAEYVRNRFDGILRDL